MWIKIRYFHNFGKIHKRQKKESSVQFNEILLHCEWLMNLSDETISGVLKNMLCVTNLDTNVELKLFHNYLIKKGG